MGVVRERLVEILKTVFGGDEHQFGDDVEAANVAGWDSLGHITLVAAVEREFGVRFSIREISDLKNPDQNIGTFVRRIESKMTSAGGDEIV